MFFRLLAILSLALALPLALDAGSSMDPNGSSFDDGPGIDPDGAQVCYSACVDPNG